MEHWLLDCSVRPFTLAQNGILDVMICHVLDVHPLYISGEGAEVITLAGRCTVLRSVLACASSSTTAALQAASCSRPTERCNKIRLELLAITASNTDPLLPWNSGRSATWNVTAVDTLGNAYLRGWRWKCKYWKTQIRKMRERACKYFLWKLQ